MSSAEEEEVGPSAGVDDELESSGPSSDSENESEDIDSDSDNDSEGQSSDVNDSKSEDDVSEGNSTIDVTFEFFDPKESDFHGLKALLQNYLDGADFAISELADLVIKQSTVGTVLKSSDDGDPIGVLTVFNLGRTHACLKEIRDYAMAKCSDAALKSQFEKVWCSPQAGLIVGERLINCPPQLAPPLQQALFDELDWATEDEPTEELRQSFKLNQFILISRIFTDPSVALKQTKSSSKKRQKKEELIVYGKPEDQLYHKHCTHSYTFALNKPVAKDELQPLRLVMLLTRAQIDSARAELDKMMSAE